MIPRSPVADPRPGHPSDANEVWQGAQEWLRVQASEETLSPSSGTALTSRASGYRRTVINALGDLLVRAWRAQHADDGGGVYDEVLHTVSVRAAADGALRKADIGALVLWKRITAQATWASRLMLTSDARVLAATGAAYERANDPSVALPDAGQAARVALRDLPGMGGTAALASAVLLALAPKRMAVWDRRVATTLSALGKFPAQRTGFYGRYLTTTLELAEAMGGVSNEGPFHSPRR